MQIDLTSDETSRCAGITVTVTVSIQISWRRARSQIAWSALEVV